MLTLHHADGRQWPVPDEFALLTTMEPAEFVALVDLARAQARLDASTRPTVAGEIVHAVNCRARRDATARDESPPACRWIVDPAGGFACLQCGTWAKPDSERARVIGLATRPRPADGLVHVSELRVGDTFRFVDDEGVGDLRKATRIRPHADGAITVDAVSTGGGFTSSTRCTDSEDGRVMVEIISRVGVAGNPPLP